MPLVSQSVPSFKGGVSQQPDIIRFPDQVTELINGFPNEVEGLQKRPPTIHVKRISDRVDSSKKKYHIINRDETEQYILQLGSGEFQVFDLNGNARACSFENDAARQYITANNPKESLRAVTVADYTFVLNTEKVVDQVEGTSDSGRQDTSLVYIKNAQYAKTYAVYIGGTYICGVITPDGGEAKQAVQTNTAYIARALYGLMTQGVSYIPEGENVGGSYDDLLNQVGGRATMGYSRSGASVSGYRIEMIGDSMISITSQSSWTPPSILVKDGFGNQNALAYSGKVSAVNKLPPIAPDGYIMQVSGEKKSEDDDFYVRWSSHDKIWKETIAPRIPYQINPRNMPHAIVRESDGSFKLKKLPWVGRGSGNENTNPDPSFIGRRINDIFFYRNRLGVISDESIILSSTNDFFNFWFKSSAAIADTDPIDVSVSSNKVATLTHAVPFARELMLFSREGQFVLSSDGVMTPKSVKCDQITNFDYNPMVQPISVGPSIFFVNDRVNYSSLMRYYSLQDVADLKDAEDVSAHIPTYIPRGVTRLSGNTTENVVTLVNTENPNTVFCYKFILQNGVSEQQAWFKWVFGYKGTEVVLAEFVDSTIYFLINSPNGLFLDKAQLTGNTLDFADEPVRLFMDRKIEYKIPENAKYSDFEDYTEISLKDVYGYVSKNTGEYSYYVVAKDGSVWEFKDWDEADGKLRLYGDHRGKSVFIGISYYFYTVLSKQNIKKSTDSGGVVAEDEGRLQLRYYWFNYSKSGVFDCHVNNEIKNKHFKYTFTGRHLGESRTKLGANNLYTGKFKFPVQDDNNEVAISVASNAPQPLNIISGGWEGLYIRRNSAV